jgi:hypothetical protein
MQRLLHMASKHDHGVARASVLLTQCGAGDGGLYLQADFQVVEAAVCWCMGSCMTVGLLSSWSHELLVHQPVGEVSVQNAEAASLQWVALCLPLHGCRG